MKWEENIINGSHSARMNHFPLSFVNVREAVKDWCGEKDDESRTQMISVLRQLAVVLGKSLFFSRILQVLAVSSHDGAIRVVSQKAHC